MKRRAKLETGLEIASKFITKGKEKQTRKQMQTQTKKKDRCKRSKFLLLKTGTVNQVMWFTLLSPLINVHCDH